MKQFTSLILATTITIAAHAAEKPNIVFIFVDDLGYGDIGVFYQNQRKAGEPRLHTPHLDQLAKDGIQLRHHYCPAPVCAPSRASLFLGQHQGNAPIRDNQFDKALPNQPSLASTLKQAGYSTALIGKWGLQGKGKDAKSWPAYPTKRGFDYFLGGVRHRDGHEHYPFDGVHFKNKKTEVWHNDKQINAGLKGCYSTDLFTAASKKWIIDHKKNSPDKPFFLFLAYDTPHAATQLATCPYPKGFGVNGGIQWLGKSGKMINTANDTPDSYLHPDYKDKDWKDVSKRFASSIRRIDNGVADIRQTLTDLGLADNTLVVFTSDNGPSKESYIRQPLNPSFFDSFGNMTGIKRDCYEGGIRVGALAAWPAAIKPNSISTTPSQMHDWMPTFCEMAKVSIPAKSDGVSILPTLTAKGEQSASTIYTEYVNGRSTPSYSEFPETLRKNKRGQMQAVRIGKYKAIRYNTKGADTAFKVFDVVADSREANNLAGKPGVPSQADWEKVVSRLHRANSSAKRPYDNAPMAAVEVKSEKPGAKLTNGKTSTKYVSRDSAKVSGFIKVDKTSTYTFGIKGKGILRIHGVLAADTDSTEPTAPTGELNLEAGYHPFTLYLADKADTKALLFGATGEATKPIPATMLFH